jgi:hypothetical protein
MRIASVFAALVITAALSLTASAQDEFTVTVLLPDAFQVGGAETTLMWESLQEAVDRHPDFSLNELPPQTLDQLLAAVGCSEPTADCLDIIHEILESDFLIFGELGATERAFLVEMTLWDFEAREAVRRFTKAVEGDVREFRRLIPLLARGIVHGDVGRVEIRVRPPEAAVLFDQRPTPSARPIVIEHLELGTHVIRASLPGYFDYSETIYVGLETEHVDVNLVPTTREIEVRGGRVWTWVALAGGVALTGAGTAFGLLAQDTQSQFDDGARALTLDLAELESLQDEGETQAMLANVFFIAGGAALAAAVVLFFVEESGVVVDSGAGRNPGVSVVPRLAADSYGLTVDVEF